MYILHLFNMALDAMYTPFTFLECHGSYQDVQGRIFQANGTGFTNTCQKQILTYMNFTTPNSQRENTTIKFSELLLNSTNAPFDSSGRDESWYILKVFLR